MIITQKSPIVFYHTTAVTDWVHSSLVAGQLPLGHLHPKQKMTKLTNS